MRQRVILIALCTAVALLAAACGSSGAQEVSNDSVAVVGDQQISKADWDALIEQTRRNFKATNRAFPKPGSVDLANLKANATQFLIQSSEYQQEADKLDAKVSDKDIDARLQQIKEQYYGNPAGQKKATQAQMDKRYQDALKQQGFSDEEVRQGIKLQVIREKVYDKVTSDVKVSDDDVRAYYDKNKKQYETPAQPESRDVRHILVKSKAKADDLYSQLQKNPGKFAQLAKKYDILKTLPNMTAFAPRFVEEGTLLARAFDATALEFKGEPVRIADGVGYYRTVGTAAFSVTNAGHPRFFVIATSAAFEA